MSSTRSSKSVSKSQSITSFVLVFSLLFSPLYLLEVKCVQFYQQAVPVPSTSSAWRFRDGFQFQIQNPVDGSYHFGYDTGKSYREEQRNSLGQVFGKYGWLDPNGILRTFEYYADKENGFRSQQTDLAPLDSPSGNIPVIGPIPKPFLYGQPYHYQPQQVHPLTQHLTFNPIHVPVPIQIPIPSQPQQQQQQPQPKQIPLPQVAPVPPPIPVRKYRNEKIKAPLLSN